MPKGSSRSAREERRARALSLVRLWFIAAAVIVVVLLGVWELVASGKAADVAAHLFGPRDVATASREVDGAVSASLVKLGVLDVTSEVEEREDARHKWLHWETRGRIPHGVGTFECNLCVTDGIRAVGGRIVRVHEGGPDWRGLRTLDMRLGVRGVETHRIVLRESPRPEDASEGAGRERESSVSGARVAIVIDDFGYNESETSRAFIAMSARLSISVLPGCPYTRSLAEAAHEAGKEVLVHLPMEPDGYPDANPGEGALLLGHSHGEIARRVNAAIEEIPQAVGVSNHMGSAFTKDRARMRTVARALGARGLFFVDSMTTPGSMGFVEAARAGVPTVRNNMFIDSKLDELGRLDVESQLRELEAIAWKRGQAVGIGHPYPETLRILRRMLPEMEERGVELVFVSELTR